VVAGGCGLATSEVISGLLHQRVSPLVAVSEVIIHHTPGPVMEAAISAVGQHDKQLLVAGTLVGFLVVAALGGVIARHNIPAGFAVFGVMAVLALLASRSRLAYTQTIAFPAVLGGLAALIALKVLVDWIPGRTAARRTVRPVDAPDPPSDRASSSRAVEVAGGNLERRRFLTTLGALGGVALIGGGLGRYLAHGRAAVEAARRRLHFPTTKPVAPAGTSVGLDGVAPWITPVSKFYRIDTSLAPPEILPSDYRLTIDGMVDRKLVLTFDDLRAMEFTEAWITLCCVSNPVGGPLISNGRWGGVRIADVLKRAGVRAGADAVKSTSDDGWTAGTPLSALTDGRNALLAMTLDGAPLPTEHGFPVRMVVPGLYGYVSGTKWVTRMEVTRFADFQSFWTQRGWSPQGPIKTESRIDVPHDGDSRPAGTVPVGGIAWAQHRGVRQVEVRVDGGSWQPATLAADPSIDSWVQWRYAWRAIAGTHTIAVRATDATGVPQTGVPADPVPNGASGYHTITVRVH
jgi:DMSO/TMAO reductase YedYZ molybdopterin-dependent catalytic subunit